MYKESCESVDSMLKNKKRIDYEYLHPEIYTKRQLIKKAFNEIFTTAKTSGFKRTIFKIGCRINKSRIFDKQITYDINDLSEVEYICDSDPENNRIAIYTAIFGGYDELKEPEYIAPNCDYFIFTDRQIPVNSVWTKIDYSNITEMKGMDAYHLSKYVKIFPNLFFSNYEYSIWVDGTTTIMADLYPFIDRMKENVIGMFDNPVHDCIYTEAAFLLYYNRVDETVINKQIKYYREEGYPEHNGMFECTIIVRKHNDNNCVRIMREWWKQIEAFSMRDQISFPYVLWKEKLNDVVTVLGPNRNFNARLCFNAHKKVNKYK